MPLIQGGPPEWIWKRPTEQLKWEVSFNPSVEGRANFELRVSCGLEFIRLQFVTSEQLQDLQSVLEALK
jgi:hypothetical protein